MKYFGDYCKVCPAKKIYPLITAQLLCLVFSEVTNCCEHAQLDVTPSRAGLRREDANYENGLLLSSRPVVRFSA